MQATHAQVLTEILDALVVFSRDGILPQEARARLRVLQQRYPNTALELLWEEEAFDRSVHYDALLHCAEHGTISVSFCPDRALPWPLRGVQRWNNADLVRVNNQTVTMDQAIALLDFIGDDTPIMQRFVNACVIRQYLELNPIELPDAELQRAMDGSRRAQRLYTVSQTRTWMAQQSLTHAQLEQLVSEQASIAKLRDHMTEAQIEPYFEAHRREFDVAYVV